MKDKNEIKNTLRILRKEHNYSQEDLAGKLGVSRQAIAKWERGETVPDLLNCIALADLYEVTIDTLVRAVENNEDRAMVAPKGKHMFGFVKVNEKGQITIPKECRNIFRIKPGDMLLVLGDEGQGIAMVKSGEFFEYLCDTMLDRTKGR